MTRRDVFPKSNLPPEAVPWGRELENRVKILEVDNEAARQELKNGNRTTAAVTADLARQLNTLEDFLEDLEGLFRAIPKTFTLTNRETNFAASENWVTVSSITVPMDLESNHVEVSAFASGGMRYTAETGLATLQGRITIAGAAGPYVYADEFYAAGGRLAVTSPQHSRSLDRSSSFVVNYQVRAEEAASYQADPDNYASLTVIASLTG